MGWKVSSILPDPSVRPVLTLNSALGITKRVILEMYDQMSALPTMAVPAPKDESATYDVPDVSQWETWLSPGPASPDVAHPDNRE